MQTNVIEYFEKGTLLKYKDKVAIKDRSGEYTFAQIERFAKNCAALLLKRSDLIKRPVPVFLPKAHRQSLSNTGILYTGNCYANLDIKSPLPRLKKMLENLNSEVVITSAAQAPALRRLGIAEEKILLVEEAMVAEILYDNAALLKRLDSVIDTDPLYIIYTSGSTGVPKGVVIPHRGVIDYIDWAKNCYSIGEDEVIGNQAPFFFDNSTLDIYLCFASGATLVLIPEDLFAYPLKLIQYLCQERITTIFWVPSVLASVANFKILDASELPPLKKILFAGEVMPTRILTYWRQKYPQAVFSNLYGPTEITVDCTYYIVDRNFKDEEPLPIGFPCRNTDILILNEQNQPVQVDEPGELCVRGSSLALGYWNNPEVTAKAFTQNPTNPHYPELIYRTGDLVHRNSRGEIMFIGRKDFQIKHLGYRIELGEIEHAVLQVDGIRNCCVMYNQDKKEIILFHESNQDMSPAVIRESLSKRLAKYMLPTVFHQLDKMPLNGSGKIDRQKLMAGVN